VSRLTLVILPNNNSAFAFSLCTMYLLPLMRLASVCQVHKKKKSSPFSYPWGSHGDEVLATSFS